MSDARRRFIIRNHNTKNFGISDLIYSILPVNYKAFGKSGLSAELFNAVSRGQSAMDQFYMDDDEKFWSDSLLLF